MHPTSQWGINPKPSRDYSRGSLAESSIKYYSDGDTAWVRRYTGPGKHTNIPYAIAVDTCGNVYVTGQSDGFRSTIKYDSCGNECWVRGYDRPGTGYAIKLDNSGNAYVSGMHFTVKYDSSGNELWIGSWGGYDNALDTSGNVYATGGTQDYVTVKYHPGGDTAWLRTYNGYGDSSDVANAIATDDSGNVYVTGYSWYDGWKKYDYVTIKYDRAGNELWVIRYNGPEYGKDYAYAMAIDEAANVYVTGESPGYGTSDDYCTVKYDSSGQQVWVATYAGPSIYSDEAHDIAVDGSGNVYVTGFSKFSSYWDRDYATVKYDSSGNEMWVRRYDGPANHEDWAFAIAVDNSGSVYVTGYSIDVNHEYDYLTIKYVQFLRADANKDEIVDIVDAVYLLNYTLKAGPAPIPAPIVADATCDGKVDIDDIIYLLDYLFRSGPAPCI